MTTFEPSITGFREFQKFTKHECEMGRCSKAEAIDAILGKAIEILQALKMPEEPIASDPIEDAKTMYLNN